MDATQRALKILKQLVAFDTTSHLPNLPLIEHIEAYLAAYGIKGQRIGNQPGKGGLLVRIGPDKKGGIALSGHSDVVPVAGQAWTNDPFRMHQEGDKLFGRGTTDMKGFIACCLAMVPDWLKMGLKEPLLLLISYNEEIGCLAAGEVAQQMQKLGWQPRFAVIGEPTSMMPVHAHKGIVSFSTTITGREAHSSQTQLGVNTIHIAAKLIGFLERLAEGLKQQIQDDFIPPYSTLQVGMIEGGTARNIVPRETRFLWEIRPLPGNHAHDILDPFFAYCRELESDMQKTFAGASIISQQMSNVLPLKPETDSALVQQMLRLSESNRFGSVAYGTEAGIIQSHGFPCFVCGPGDIAQAHIADEYIEINQLERCLRFLEACGKELSL
jgi:acetylornithine deacetylase